jgi:CBS domain-containing protein
MSPRAAWRLEQLGFSPVYDYAGGEVDWLAAGHPTEGPASSATRVISATDATVPTCGLNDLAGPAAAAAERAGWSICVVVNDARIVAGRLRVGTVPADDQRRAGEVMEPGPATIRAHEDLAATLTRMAERHVDVLLVTTPEGELLGAVRSRP